MFHVLVVFCWYFTL